MVFRPMLCLKQDELWDDARPRPVEPYRCGEVVVLDENIFTQYPEVRVALVRRRWYGGYIHPALLKSHHPLLKIAQQFVRHDDLATAAVIGSLVLEPSRLMSISQGVMRDLALVQLGPNREFINKILTKFLDPGLIRHLKAVSQQRKVVICDPFGGFGVLGYFIADCLQNFIGNNFIIKIIDIAKEPHVLSKDMIEILGKKSFSRVRDKIVLVQGDGIILESIDEQECDVIVSTLALHEHSHQRVVEFFAAALSKLRPGGKLIVADTTRYSTILKRARSRLRLLGKVGMAAVFINHVLKARRGQKISDLYKSYVRESHWLAESGIRSYESGFTEEELTAMMVKAGAEKKRMVVGYDFSPPIGAISLEYSREQ